MSEVRRLVVTGLVQGVGYRRYVQRYARDLNLARQLMGDQNLNYIGYSYGTWLGSWYAKLFPEHTGRMLLDGNTSFNAPFEETFGFQPMAFERDFRDAVAPYLARQNAYFGLGATGSDVYATQNGLEVSDHYLIPTIPDRLSTYGIPA